MIAGSQKKNREWVANSLLIFRYIIKDYLKYVTGISILCIFLFIFFDFIHRTTGYFVKYQATTESIILLYIYLAPTVVVEVLPISSLLGSVIAMILLSRTNEITAMRAAGLGPFAIGLPIAIGASFISLLCFAFSEFIVPITAIKMRNVETVLIERRPTAEASDATKWFRDGRELIHFDTFDPTRKVMDGVTLIDVGDDFLPRSFTDAKAAEFQQGTGAWRLTNVSRTFLGDHGESTLGEKLTSILVFLPFKPDQLKKERREPNEMRYTELANSVKLGEETGMDTAGLRVDYHLKFAYPLAAFVVSLIGLKFTYRSERTLETAKGVLQAFSIGISYWFIMNAARAMGKQGTLPPMLAAWSGNLVVLTAAFILLWRARRLT